MKAVMIQLENTGSDDIRTVWVNDVTKITMDCGRLVINTNFRHYTGFYYIDFPLPNVRSLYTSDIWEHDQYALVIWS